MPEIQTMSELDRYNSVDSEQELVILECRAGHLWETPRPRRGRWPQICPRHRRFFLERISARMHPPDRILEEWRKQGASLCDPEYRWRWEKVWLDTVRLIGAKGNSWNAVDMTGIEEYIRALRMVEVHRTFAQDEPYVSSSYGAVKPHPGFALADKEEIRAKKLAIELGLRPPEEDTTPKHTNRVKTHTDDQYETRLQEEAAEVDHIRSATGPDGFEL